MRESTAISLTRMLEITTRTGTSARVFRRIEGRPRISVAGKTGTLATASSRRQVSWFAGFAPSREPEVAIAVMLSNDLSWWMKANAVARELLDAYFSRRDRSP